MSATPRLRAVPVDPPLTWQDRFWDAAANVTLLGLLVVGAAEVVVRKFWPGLLAVGVYVAYNTRRRRV